MAPKDKHRRPILVGKAERVETTPNIFDDTPAEPDEPALDDDEKWRQDKANLHSLSQSLADADIEVIEAERNLTAAHKRVGDSIAARDKLKQELAAHRAKLGK